MSGEVLQVDDNSCCASCGITANDDMKLKICTACKLVRYCSVKCQKDHRSKHKRACKKRVAELRDEILFQQPESSNFGDCPICCLPHPIDRTNLSCHATVMSCCGKIICVGCNRANQIREIEESLQQICPFCRYLVPETVEEADKLLMRRVEANDPLSLVEVGKQCGIEGDNAGAFKYWTKAAELGDAEAHFCLFILYHDGKAVEKDRKKAVYHLEHSAIAGHHYARYNLGCIDQNTGRIERAVKHWIIAANLGLDDAVQKLKESFHWGDVSKEDFAAALRGHQAAVDATKSPQRSEAAIEMDSTNLMSEVLDAMDDCASCGITANDNIELKKCTACKLVRYCSVKCQKEHRPKHKRACKKRAAELHDEILFQQPESSHLGDCPICCLPHPVGKTKTVTMGCCSKIICDGCDYGNKKREIAKSLQQRCPFCRHPAPKTVEEADKNSLRRVESNDPVSLNEVG
eukprot:scaffold5256_cov70-Skeletonema_dohrnii-CCMP3373.AAC.1